METTDQITAEYIDHMGDDLRAVNAAPGFFGAQSKSLTEGDQALIRYLGSHKHETPFEHCTLTVLVSCPDANQQADHGHRTFSYNEISRRYTDVGLEVFQPAEWRGQSKNNKQCSDGLIEQQAEAEAIYRQAASYGVAAYEQLRSIGVCREQARFVLPQGLMTQFYATGNLRNWTKFVQLRIAADAQGEVRVVGDQVHSLLMTHFPHSTKALLNAEETTGTKG